MQQDFINQFDLQDDSSKYEQYVQFQCLEFKNQKLDKIRFQCNLKLLQKKIIMLFGFPSIKVDSDRIYRYLNGILNQSENEQLKKVRILISFIGEVTQIINWDDRVHIIRQRVLQFFNFHGLEINWSDEQWLNEIDSIVTIRIENHYYDTIPNDTFSYVSLFNVLSIKLPKELQDLNHHSFKQIQASNLIDDFHLLCNIDEFRIVRNMRIFIQKITNKLNEFMSILIIMDTKDDYIGYNLKNRYQLLLQQLQDILKSFHLTILNENSITNNKKQKQDVDSSSENQQLTSEKQQLTSETQTLTTIIQGRFESKTKKQKKKVKFEQHIHYKSSLLYKINQNDNNEKINYSNYNLNSPQIYDIHKANDLISLFQNQSIYNSRINIPQFSSYECTQEILKQKILTYEFIQFQIEKLGFPCISLNKNELIQVLEDHKLFDSDKKSLVQKLIKILQESFVSKKDCLDVFQQVRDTALDLLSEISLEYPIEELKSIYEEQCIRKAKMSVYGNLKNGEFSFQELSQILNRKFPQQLYKLKCQSTKIIFQSQNIQPLLDIFNFQDLRNIRVTQSYINQIYTCLQVLITFKEQLQSNFDQELVQNFLQMEKQYLDIINQPLNFHIDSPNYFQNQNQNLYKNLGFQDNLFNQQIKEQHLQIKDLNSNKLQPQFENQNQDYQQNHELYFDFQDQEEFNFLNYNYQKRLHYFSVLSSPNIQDSPRFSFINKSQQYSQDLQLNSDEELYSFYFSK